MKQAFLFMLVFFLFTHASAQKKTFLRIYNTQGEKIASGYFAGTIDSALMLSKNERFKTIYFNEIGVIKTKRTIGHTIAVISAVTAAVAAIVFVAGSGGDSWFSYSAGEGLAGGLLFGGGTGLLIGAVAGALKNPRTYLIEGSYIEWIKAKQILDKMPVYRYAPATLAN